MSAFQAIVLGIVQGLTEFLPISSTAHLRIIPAFLGWDDPGAAFTAVIQLGTMAAVVLHFWSDLWRIATTWLKSLRDKRLRGELDARLGWYIGLGTIPIVIFGYLLARPDRDGWPEPRADRHRDDRRRSRALACRARRQASSGARPDQLD